VRLRARRCIGFDEVKDCRPSLRVLEVGKADLAHRADAVHYLAPADRPGGGVSDEP
jgi:hypothetical protein